MRAGALLVALVVACGSSSSTSSSGGGQMGAACTCPSESDAGDFHVKGYEGVGVKDHVDQIRAMAETLLPYLKTRWSR